MIQIYTKNKYYHLGFDWDHPYLASALRRASQLGFKKYKVDDGKIKLIPQKYNTI